LIETQQNEPSVFKLRNIRYFIAFRLFFNSRFYYPVFAILFLDFGLTLERFAILNTIWAATIVIMEVPSGALADVFGRVKLLRISGWLMVLEMALLCFAPTGNIEILFIIFIFNRICSGAAEAAASGADESLAYETLLKYSAQGQWSKVLARQMRVTAIGSMVAMILGAALYDPAVVQRLSNLLGMHVTITQDISLRIPLILTLFFAFGTLISTYRMEETSTNLACQTGSLKICCQSIASSFKVIYKAGFWIWRQPFASVIILSGLVFDHVTRIVITLGSQYFRLIKIPEATFGVIGAAMAGVGICVASLAENLAERRSPMFNCCIIGGLTLFGLIGVSVFFPWVGLVPVLALTVALALVHFILSNYLNRITDSHQRATVLSFKGLAFNLAYGLGGMLFAILLAHLRSSFTAVHLDWYDSAIEASVFKSAVGWFPFYFLVLMIALVIFARCRMRNTEYHHLK